jgi:hypothetical protein
MTKKLKKDYKQYTYKFEEFFNNEETYKEFEKFCIKSRNGGKNIYFKYQEMLEFLKKYNEFIKLNNFDECHKEIKLIINQHIKEFSPKEINIPQELRKDILNNLEKINKDSSLEFLKTIFDETVISTKTSLKIDMFQRFIKDSDFFDYCDKIDNDKFLKFATLNNENIENNIEKKEKCLIQ